MLEVLEPAAVTEPATVRKSLWVPESTLPCPSLVGPALLNPHRCCSVGALRGAQVEGCTISSHS